MIADQHAPVIGHLTIHSHSEMARTTLMVRGSLTSASGARLKNATEALVGQGHSANVVMDFSKVALFDHAGIGVLMQLETWLSSRCGGLWVKNPNKPLIKALNQIKQGVSCSEHAGFDTTPAHRPSHGETR